MLILYIINNYKFWSYVHNWILSPINWITDLGAFQAFAGGGRGGGVVFLGKFFFALNHLLGCLKQFQQYFFWLDFGPRLTPASQPRWINPFLFFLFFETFPKSRINNSNCEEKETILLEQNINKQQIVLKLIRNLPLSIR